MKISTETRFFLVSACFTDLYKQGSYSDGLRVIFLLIYLEVLNLIFIFVL